MFVRIGHNFWIGSWGWMDCVLAVILVWATVSMTLNHLYVRGKDVNDDDSPAGN